MKKGSLSLSINAIVVLILAIVVMAFALPFIKDLFEKTKGGIIGQFPEVEIYATAQDPIGIGNEFYIKPGQEKKMSLHIYNNQDSKVQVRKLVPGYNDIVFSCPSGNQPITTAYEPITLLEPGKSTKIKVIFKGQTGMKNNDICEITVGGGHSGYPSQITQSFFLVTQ